VGVIGKQIGKNHGRSNLEGNLKPNPSQYNGTLKNSICHRCKKSLNNLNRLEQDEHEKKCLQQKTLF
jgi:hypothetical protein